jgi:bacterioferritin (cytochrome b1)
MAADRRQNVLEVLGRAIAVQAVAIEAYRAAMDHLHVHDDREQFQQFMHEHERHGSDLTALAHDLGAAPTPRSYVMRWVAMGKVALAGLVDERAVIFAMKTIEDRVVRACERALRAQVLPTNAREMLERHRRDEERHISWFAARLEVLAAPGEHA